MLEKYHSIVATVRAMLSGRGCSDITLANNDYMYITSLTSSIKLKHFDNIIIESHRIMINFINFVIYFNLEFNFCYQYVRSLSCSEQFTAEVTFEA